MAHSVTSNTLFSEQHIKSVSELTTLLAEHKKLLLSIDAGDYLAAEKQLKLLQSWPEHFVRVREAFGDLDVAGITESIRNAAQDQRLHFEEDLVQELRAAGLRVQGQWPDFVVNDIFRLNIDLKRVAATVNGLQIRPVVPRNIAAYIKSNEPTDLSPDETSEFLRLLTDAYTHALDSSGLSNSTEYADIRAIYSAIRAGRRSYSPQQFGVDLYKLVHGAGIPKNTSLEFSPAQNAAGGIFVPSPGGGNYIAAIRIVSGNPDD